MISSLRLNNTNRYLNLERKILPQFSFRRADQHGKDQQWLEIGTMGLIGCMEAELCCLTRLFLSSKNMENRAAIVGSVKDGTRGNWMERGSATVQTEREKGRMRTMGRFLVESSR